jgi:DNA replication protein DnaC
MALHTKILTGPWRVLFARTGDLVQRLQAARRDLRLPAELARLDRFCVFRRLVTADSDGS